MNPGTTPQEIVGQRFQQIIDDQLYLKPMDRYDHAVWYINITTGEAAINGFESIFEQLHTNEGLMELEIALRNIQEDQLAGWFEKIRILLESNNFWLDDMNDFEKLPANIQTEFQLLKKEINANDRMWYLDEKILALKV